MHWVRWALKVTFRTYLTGAILKVTPHSAGSTPCSGFAHTAPTRIIGTCLGLSIKRGCIWQAHLVPVFSNSVTRRNTQRINTFLHTFLHTLLLALLPPPDESRVDNVGGCIFIASRIVCYLACYKYGLRFCFLSHFLPSLFSCSAQTSSNRHSTRSCLNRPFSNPQRRFKTQHTLSRHYKYILHMLVTYCRLLLLTNLPILKLIFHILSLYRIRSSSIAIQAWRRVILKKRVRARSGKCRIRHCALVSITGSLPCCRCQSNVLQNWVKLPICRARGVYQLPRCSLCQ